MDETTVTAPDRPSGAAPGDLRRARRRAFKAALLVAVLLLLAGCGSSGKSTSATQPSSIEGTELEQLPVAPGAAAPPAIPAGSQHVDPAYLRSVFTDAQALWRHEFSAASHPFAPAGLVLFATTVHSGCGLQENSGPFYCAASRSIYLDTPFFEALARHAGVGPFAQAYVIGHEFGHHVQHLLGIDARVAAANHQDPAGENARSVRVELQADCLAGVWAHSAYSRGHVSVSDLEDALKTAALVGDDFQARAAGRTVDPGLFTHGSSEQRQRWFVTGYDSGRPGSCDTFAHPTV